MINFTGDAQVYCNVIRELFSLEVKPEEILELFRAVGLLNPGGAPYRERVKKFFEVANFSLHMVKALRGVSRKTRAVLLEGGCGRSYLSFFINFLISKADIRDAYFMGADQNPKLIEGCNQVKEALGFRNMNFYASKIIDFEPPEEVDEVHLVFSLHACDTATDETIAKGIQLKARYIIVAPCCQREIMRQLERVSKGKGARPLRGLTEKHLLREQLAITLTETLRTLALEAAGYQVDVFTFVPSRYTPKNLMIRAKRTGLQRSEALQRYHELKEFFGLRPKIGDFLPQVLGKGTVTEEAFI